MTKLKEYLKRGR